MTSGQMTVQIAVRLPAAQVQAIDQVVGEVHASRSDVVRRALELYLYRLACEHDARVYDEQPLTEREMALADGPQIWESVPPW